MIYFFGKGKMAWFLVNRKKWIKEIKVKLNFKEKDNWCKKGPRETGKRMRNTIPQARSESIWVQSMFPNFLYRTAFFLPLKKKKRHSCWKLRSRVNFFSFICKTNAPSSSYHDCRKQDSHCYLFTQGQCYSTKS